MLMNSIHAYNIHLNLCLVSPNSNFHLQKHHLAKLVKLRRKALQGVSRAAYQLFENNKVKEALTQANTLLVPGLAALTVNHCEGDMEVVEAVREEWCQYLTHPGLTEGNSLIYTAFFFFIVS